MRLFHDTKHQKSGVKHKETQTTFILLSDQCGPPKIDVVHQFILCAYLTRYILRQFPIYHDLCGSFGVLGVAPVHWQGAEPSGAHAGSMHI